MSNSVERFMSEGMLAQQAGNTHVETSWRGPFQTTSSEHVKLDPVTEDVSGHYVHEIFSGDALGGGQEIATLNGETITRLFAGGTIPPEKLAELGITRSDITSFLKQSLIQAEGLTRLDENYSPKAEGDWQYSYKVLDQYPETGLSVGLEEIYFKGKVVSAYGFVKSPIK